jgi:hypothetical protein
MFLSGNGPWQQSVYLPIDGDLKGYLSGRSTRTFHTPPSYNAKTQCRKVKNSQMVQNTFHWKRAGCNNSHSYIPEIRQHYGLAIIFVFSHVGTWNSCYLPTYFWYHIIYVLSFPSPRYTQNRNLVCICVILTCLEMKDDWNDGTIKQWRKFSVGRGATTPHLHEKLMNFRKFWPKRGLKTVFSSANGGYVGNLKVLSEI